MPSRLRPRQYLCSSLPHCVRHRHVPFWLCVPPCPGVEGLAPGPSVALSCWLPSVGS